MSIRVYNTLSRQKEPFETVVPGKVGMYLCGPTVYKPSHIGHMVGPVIFDTIKRYLQYAGYDVTYIINITDVDDKLIARAAELGTTMTAVAQDMTRDYFENLKAFGVDTVDRFPLATEHITEMRVIIQRLIGRGFAYELDGDVYFDTAKDKNYGQLSRRQLDEVLAGTRVEANDRKRHPADFALWKKSRDGEPSWESPWGPGRPGWHIECSAMSMKYLGETLDIHGGGLDLMFPHHENELAQAECCTGKKFTRYWLHNGLMQAGKQAGKVGGGHDRHGDISGDLAAQEAGKISKSRGSSSVRELFEKFHPEAIRLFLLSTHYRSPIEFTDEALAEATKSIDGFYRLFESYERITGHTIYELEYPVLKSAAAPIAASASTFGAEVSALRARFIESMDDDFNTGAATGVLYELRRVINNLIHTRNLETATERNAESLTELTAGMTTLRELAAILGIFRAPLQPAAAADDGFSADLMDLILELRADLRAAKNWTLADKIRDRMKTLCVVIEDRKDGVVWRRERN